jgi:hypothetical protein
LVRELEGQILMATKKSNKSEDEYISGAVGRTQASEETKGQ